MTPAGTAAAGATPVEGPLSRREVRWSRRRNRRLVVGGLALMLSLLAAAALMGARRDAPRAGVTVPAPPASAGVGAG
jgi:hypothetical protein